MSRRATVHMPSLPALRVGIRPPVVLPVRRHQRTLAEHIEPFLFWLKTVRGRASNTVNAYRSDLEDFAAFCAEAGVEDPRHVTHQLIEFFVGWLQERGERAPSTAARRLHAIRGLFKYLVREGAVERDVAAVAFGPTRTPRGLPNYLTAAEQEKVLTALRRDQTLLGRRDYALIATMLFTGLRCEETATLQTGHLNLEAGLLRVYQGKGGKDREVPLVGRLQGILGSYLAEIRPRLLGGVEAPWVFVHGYAHGRYNGTRPRRVGKWATKPLATRMVWRIVSRRVSPLVGRPVHPHVLRHSFASRLRAAGADLQLIQEVLGHADIGTTTIYAHLATPTRRQAIERLLGQGAGQKGMTP